uniref:Nucleolar protein 58-like n=2 Tax=Hirondellea gigas TaxID=1518452 RepID=A0A6A7FS29_9CRUS
MLVLFETAAGFAVFKLLDEKKIQNVENMAEAFLTAESAANVVQLSEFHKFHDSAEALAASVSINEGNMCKSLKVLIKKVIKKELHKQLLVLDAKLGNSIKNKFPELNIVSSSHVSELIRCIRGQMNSLIPGISEKESSAMMLGLGHNLARYKLKFSPDKVDIMVVQAVKLLDDLDKELNNYVMRAKEWYGWHFPELAKILTDNTSYINTILKMGFRENASTTDLSEFMSEELSDRVKEAAEVSMGSEISDMDICYMRYLCTEIMELTAYRSHLHEYLTHRMVSLAPNVSILLGELIGARLISHSGSLLNLAKNPASTIQLIGAEKALFRALKTKKQTPKYGLIYHAELITKAPTKCKGKMARMLAAKVALATRVDAMGEETNYDLGINHRVALLSKINLWNSGKSHKISGQSKHFTPQSYISDNRAGQGHYSARQDSTITGIKKDEDQDLENNTPSKKIKKDEKPLITEMVESPEKKKKKKKKNRDADETQEQDTIITETSVAEPTSEKKKKRKRAAEDADTTVDASVLDTTTEKKKKKKKHAEVKEETMELDDSAIPEPTSEKKKKKKKKDKAAEDE